MRLEIQDDYAVILARSTQASNHSWARFEGQSVSAETPEPVTPPFFGRHVLQLSHCHVDSANSRVHALASYETSII